MNYEHYNLITDDEDAEHIETQINQLINKLINQ